MRAESIGTLAPARADRVRTLLGLGLTLGLGSLPYPVWDDEFADTAHLLGNEAIYWTLVVATLFYVLRIERRPLASIGLRRFGWRDAGAALAIAVATIGALAALFLVVFPWLGVGEAQNLSQLASAPPWWLAISVLRAGVSEEVLFRGYPIERLLEWSGSRTLAFLLPLGLFALAHVGPWGWLHLAVAGVGGALLSLLYLWRRNLWANIFAHCLIDAMAMFGNG
jgi:membrane protease YdiL (CAAX protease family)